MSNNLVLELFPGISLFGRAFEEQGFCVVRGPDLLWGGDIKSFHPPAGPWGGIIGGPPCQAHSRLRPLVEHVYGPDAVAEDLIPEFERCVREAQPDWFQMEEVEQAPLPVVPGYIVRDELVCDVWVGGDTSRKRRFSFGTRDGRRLEVETLALHCPNPHPAVLASGGYWVPVKTSEGTKRRKVRGVVVFGDKSNAYFHKAKLLQGLPPEFDVPGMTVKGKIKAIGNGVPMALGRAVAKAVKASLCLPACLCTRTDAWRCAVQQGLSTLSCHCWCHRMRPFVELDVE